MTDNKPVEYTWHVPSMDGRSTFHAVWTTPAKELDLCVNSHHIGTFTFEEAVRYQKNLQKSLEGMEMLAVRLPSESGKVLHAFNPGCGTSIRTFAYVQLEHDQETDDPEVTILSLFEAKEFCDTLDLIVTFIRRRVCEKGGRT